MKAAVLLLGLTACGFPDPDYFIRGVAVWADGMNVSKQCMESMFEWVEKSWPCGRPKHTYAFNSIHWQKEPFPCGDALPGKNCAGLYKDYAPLGAVMWIWRNPENIYATSWLHEINHHYLRHTTGDADGDHSDSSWECVSAHTYWLAHHKGAWKGCE